MLDTFHPAVRQWFARELGSPTAPQAAAWPRIAAGEDTLVAAPTGSGKTLAAFLAMLDELVRQGLEAGLDDTTRVVYVSPLKALSHDIHKNLQAPLEGIRQELERLGLPDVDLRAAVRTGDTTQSARAALNKRPPHLLVTTPESLYLLLTSVAGRKTLSTVHSVIVDEIHALAGNKRGAHLALSLERLEALAGRRLRRIGLSATQKPIEEVARFLVGTGRKLPHIVDAGHRRELDLELELPGSALEAVTSAEVWVEVLNRIEALIRQHRTTLVFVNTRRLCERLTHQLSERLGEQAITSHHGSLSTRLRHDAEQRLKRGELKALVATASLELGIDIGSVDLVCQVGSTRAISTFLQRVGRSGHHLAGTPKGRLFPLSRDELAECAALIAAVRAGDLDALSIPKGPLDILAQQIVAETAGVEWNEEAMFALVRRAYPYRDLPRQDFDAVIEMLASGFSSRRGRRGAHLFHDAVHGLLKPRKGARLAALTSGGAIPDNADYAVLQEPTATRIGTINEDFAIESMPGDIFLLGNTSWQITKVESGRVRVIDAHGQPPTLPFWLGEAPGRTRELSSAVSDLRRRVDATLADPDAARSLLRRDYGIPDSGAEQLVSYLAAAKRDLGALPTKTHIIAERFFDEAGGMQLVLHAPFGSRINRAWGLALRKCFCRTFNFELQAAATEDAIVLSLGAQHSFPLEDVFRFLRPEAARDVLIQALLDAPMFKTRWRWNASRSLALLRRRGGQATPAAIQRMEAEDLVAAVFPDQLACAENLVGDRQIPDHPLVRQTIDDCLTEAMDIDGFLAILEDLWAGRITTAARNLPEPSPLSHEVLNARPYAYLDDAPLEERRTRAVYLRRTLDEQSQRELGALDPEAIARVRADLWPAPRSLDEAHDGLMQVGLVWPDEVSPEMRAWLDELVTAGRAARLTTPLTPPLPLAGEADGRAAAAGEGAAPWVAAERLMEVRAVHPSSAPTLVLPPRLQERVPADPDTALKELLRGRLEVSGPVTALELAARHGVSETLADIALAALEAEGFVLRGSFTPGAAAREWCERRVLARIHRLTINKLRAEIEPVSTAELWRFLLAWQRVLPSFRAQGPEGLASVVEALEGFPSPAVAWEHELLPSRIADYDPAWLDSLCLQGRVGWGRLRLNGEVENGHGAAPVRTTPITLFLREHAGRLLDPERHVIEPSHGAARLLSVLESRGALFHAEMVRHSGLLPSQAEAALAELVAIGRVTSDGFAGLRALLVPAQKRQEQRRRRGVASLEAAGRWSQLGGAEEMTPEARAEAQARLLLRRYGVVFRTLVQREPVNVPWRDLARALRRLEARGEIRGGHFVSGPGGEQFALPDAIGLLRKLRREGPTGELVALSAADPLNLLGVLLPGPRLAASPRNRLVLQDGVPLAVLEAGEIRRLPADTSAGDSEIERALQPVRRSRVLSGLSLPSH